MISEATVILLGCTSAGTESLKNLVLPGVGRFIIVDDNIVEERDLGNDFFVTVNDLGKNKAQVATELLNEMNTDVKGEYCIMSPCDYI